MINRRTILKTGLTIPILGPFLPAANTAVDRSYLENDPDMLLSYLLARLNALAAKWDGVRAGLKTPADIEARNRFVREKTLEMIGGYPERTPLQAVVVSKHQRRGYRFENVMYQSRPNFWVTGNLYIPDGAGPFPAVLSPCGHYPLARMYPDYQCLYTNLVRSGFVVLAYDPIGQGERQQYWNPQTDIFDVPNPDYEHSLPGQVQLLMGENLTQYIVWDGMRGIDYLLTRPEVDGQKIGCAGHSGGSMQTLFISVLDARVKCIAMNESATGHWWPAQFPMWAPLPVPDAEQNLFPAAIYGIDRCDLNVALAPRPLLTTIEYYHPPSGRIDQPGFNSAVEHLRERYRQLGVPEKFATEEATDPHAWTPKLRLATNRWFSRWFYGRPGPEKEPDFEPEKPQTLYCTPDGSLRYSQQGDTVFSLLLKKQATLPPPRQTAATETEIRDVLHLGKVSGPLGARRLTITPRKGYQVEKVQFVSEPGIYIPAWIFIPEQRGSQSTALCFNDAGKEADGMEFGAYEGMARAGRMVIAVDVRGVGETRTPHLQRGDLPPFRTLFDAETELTYMTWYMDESLFGMRVQDVLRTVEYARSRPDVEPNRIEVIGRGAGALWVLYAAALDPSIASVVAESGLLSYRSLAQTDRYHYNASIFLRGVLGRFDLPHVAAAIAPRPLKLLHPVDPMKRATPVEKVRDVYRFTIETYQKAGAADLFRIS